MLSALEDIHIPDNSHSLPTSEVCAALAVDLQGLNPQEVQQRQQHFGLNQLPFVSPVGLLQIFLHQFLNPLIYILLMAAAVSLVIGEFSDAFFIAIVLILNAVIGSVQEYSAQQTATALQGLVTHTAHVMRDGDTYDIDAAELVPGDIVLLESGNKVPADLRLLKAQNLELDEALLTGESLPVEQNVDVIVDEDAAMGDRINMAYSGTLVSRGRGVGVVTATGLYTEVGQLAEAVLAKRLVKPPLMIRMERFSLRISIVIGFVIVILAAISLSRGMAFTEMMFIAIALAVATIPEGLPVAMTIALSISMRRMAKRNVIVRKLVTVEALGSCTYIATDKTGTLTVNDLTVRRLIVPDGNEMFVSGEGLSTQGDITSSTGKLSDWLQRIAQTMVLANEAYIGKRDGVWAHQGDAVDVAMLVMAHKAGYTRPKELLNCPELASIPYESTLQFSASVNQVADNTKVFAKGALEKLLPMCQSMATLEGDSAINQTVIEQQANALAAKGFRVMAMVCGDIDFKEDAYLEPSHLNNLTLLGLVAMMDPLRHEVPAAIAACHSAGIEVGMITGDHPVTALFIGQELGLVTAANQVVTGHDVHHAKTASAQKMDSLIQTGSVFARVEPQQKLDIVQSLQRSGHFVAVTGDGANDAPALRTAHVGVAMGKTGTDVARETADMILTDDNFASIIAGIEEGRIAYANVRKVILLLLATGAGELVLFALSLIAGLPLPLTAVQLLWLNLVTNGIQDVALAFEPGEGDELQRPPRSPKEPIFNRLMIERVLVVSAVIGVVGFLAFEWMLSRGYSVDAARNGVLFLMVLFENVYVFNCRSETRSAFAQNPLRNLFLLLGTLAAQLIHIAALYTPGLREVLDVQPITLDFWVTLLSLALLAMLASEAHKFYWMRRYR